MKILQIKNEGCPKISIPTEKFDGWFYDTFGEEIEWGYKEVSLDLEYKDFGIYDGVVLRGLKDIKERLRGVAGGFDIVQFFYYPENDPTNLANWTYPNPITSNDVFCEFPVKSEFITSGIEFEYLKHETIHALFRLLNRKGVLVTETIDTGGTIEDNAKVLLQYKNILFSKENLLTSLYKKVIELLTIQKTRLEKQNHLLQTAISCIGKDMSPTQKELGCAEGVNTIYKLAFGNEIGGGSSTYLLWQSLKKRQDFEQCDYENGAIIICPTGTQRPQSELKHGHTGIIHNGMVISNNSTTGLMDKHLSLKQWEGIYKDFPILCYRKI
jgi:hypothetical protein